jgi:hypothetical protein
MQAKGYAPKVIIEGAAARRFFDVDCGIGKFLL